MAVVKYNRYFRDLLNADVDHNLPDDFRILALESATDLNPDDIDVGVVLGRAGTTEATHTGYARQTLTGEAVTQDDANDRAEFDAGDATFSSVANDGGGTIKGLLLFINGASDALSTPIAYIDTGGFPITPNGGDILIQWNAQGILQVS